MTTKNKKYTVSFEDLNSKNSREDFRKFLLKLKDELGNNFIVNIKEEATNTIWTVQAIDAWHNLQIWKAGTKGATSKTRLSFFPDSIAARARGKIENAIYR